MFKSMLLDTSCLTFQTYLPDYRDSVSKKLVSGAVDKTIHAKGSLQPFIPKPNMQVSKPSGFSLASSKWFETDVDLPTIDDVGVTKAATTTIQGRTFYVMSKFDYSEGILSTDGLFYILVMQPMKDGSV